MSALEDAFHFHSDRCYTVCAGDEEVLICGLSEPAVDGGEHDMSKVVRFRDGGSVACAKCGVMEMQIDMMELP